MKKAVLALTIAAAAPLLLSAAQERVKAEKPKEFPVLMKEIQGAWDSAKYGACMDLLQQATARCSEKRREAVLAALPKAPEGWEVQPQKDNAQANAYLGAMAATVGNIINQKYDQTDGRQSMDVTVTSDSPTLKAMLPMLKMWTTNPQMMEKGAELIRYNQHTAILRTRGDNRNLQIIIGEEHMVEVKGRLVSEEDLFRLWSQDTIDKLAAVLSN